MNSFDDALSNVPANIDVADEQPYRNDSREIEHKFADGTVMCFSLSSGNNNYWLDVFLVKNGATVFESEPYEEVSDIKLPSRFKSYEVAVNLV